MLTVDRDSQKPIFYQIYQSLKKDIVENIYLPKQKLPSSRSLSKELQVSRNTIDRAYQQLLIEGFIESKPRSGYLVSANLPEMAKASHLDIQNRYNFKDLIDFGESYDKLDFFPQKDWTKAEQEMRLQGFQHIQPANGDWDYRNQLTFFLKQTKGIDVTSEQIVIVSGFNEAASIIQNLLNLKNIAVVNPFAPNAQKVWQQLEVDVKYFKLTELANSYSLSSTFLLSANHTFPSGSYLSETNRKKLAKDLIQENKFLIELDSDGTFNYSQKSYHSIIHYAPRNSFYYSNYDDSLGAFLCMGYLVIPQQLVPKYQRLYKTMPNRISQWQQRILANMMADDSLAAHFRKLTKIYEERQKTLIRELKTNFGEKVKIIGNNYGTFVVAQFFTDKDITSLCKIAQDNKISVVNPDRCWFDKKPTFKSIIFSFRQVDNETINIGIRKLASLWDL